MGFPFLFILFSVTAGLVVGGLLGRRMAMRVRRRQLRGTLAAFPALLSTPSGWVEGTLRYRAEELQWFRDSSVTPIPEVRLERHLLEMDRLRPEDELVRSLEKAHPHEVDSGWVVARFSSPSRETPVHLALGFDESAGICAWLEAWGTVGRGHWR